MCCWLGWHWRHFCLSASEARSVALRFVRGSNRVKPETECTARKTKPHLLPKIDQTQQNSKKKKKKKKKKKQKQKWKQKNGKREEQQQKTTKEEEEGGKTWHNPPNSKNQTTATTTFIVVGVFHSLRATHKEQGQHTPAHTHTHTLSLSFFFDLLV